MRKRIQKITKPPAHDSLLKCNENVLFLKQIVTSNGKQWLYNNVEWRDPGASKMNHRQPHQRLGFIQRSWYFINGGIGRASSIMNSLENQTINPNKYSFQLDQLKATPNEKFL